MLAGASSLGIPLDAIRRASDRSAAAVEVIRLVTDVPTPIDPDVALVARLRAKLAARAMTNPLDLEVTSQQQVVTLSGDAPGEEERRAALELVRASKGVRGVVDRVEVRKTR